MNFREHFDYPAAMKQLVNYYYEQCPGSIMPLFLLYLAREGKPGEELLKVEEKIRTPLDWKNVPEQKYSSPILSQFTHEDAAELAKTDPAGGHLLDRWRCNEMDHMSIVVLYSDKRLQVIREAFQKYDEVLGDSMNKRRALFLFVQGLLQCPPEFLKNYFIDVANDILKHAGVFDEFEDIYIAKFERWILGDIKGFVFVPFSRTPYAASLLSNATVTTESTGPVSDIASMVSDIIVKGNGVKKATCVTAAKPYESLGEVKYDGVILNYAYHIVNPDDTSWHRCLKVIRNNLSEKGKYVGLIETKYLFKMVGKQKLFDSIIKDDSLEAIVLLPRRYGLALISINKAKKHQGNVKMVNLYNENLVCPTRFFQNKVSRNTRMVSTETLAKAQTTIDSFFEETIPQEDGFKIMPLGKYLKRIRKESLFGVSDSTNPECLSAVHIDREKPYSPYDFWAESLPIDSFSIFEPTYYLDTNALLVNESGDLEPHIYRGIREPAVFSEGLAFAVSSQMWPPYLINELRKPYVLSQLNRWSASKERLHSEDEILDLKIYVPDCDDPYEKELDICKKELDNSILPNGSVIEDDEGNYCYTIEECLGIGGFGISYKATRESSWNTDEETKTVVLKEFFSGQEDGSERFNGQRVAMVVGDIRSIRQNRDLYSYLVKFIDEAEAMESFSKFPNCRVRRARNIFKCSRTNTYYYEMDYYRFGTLEDAMKENGPIGEEELIERVMKPVAIALDTMHNNHWLHLDIKAPNVVIDDDGYAILGDLGISQHYDENGKKITKGGGAGTPGCCCRLQRNMEYIEQFHPELDIYSFAALMYYGLTGNYVDHFSPEDLDEPFVEISEQGKKALKKALDPELETTPKSVREFMHMLPGCEDMVFEDIQPVEDEPEFNLDDIDLDDFADMPYFT